MYESHPDLYALGFSLAGLSGWSQLCILVGCIFATFMVQGFLVEHFTKEGFRFAWASAFIEMLFFTVFSFVETRVLKGCDGIGCFGRLDRRVMANDTRELKETMKQWLCCNNGNEGFTCTEVFLSNNGSINSIPSNNNRLHARNDASDNNNNKSTYSYTADNVPWMQYVIVAVSLTLARGLTWVSLSNLSYPTALLVKSSKLVAVMLGGVLFLHKKYGWLDYGVACAIVSGMVLFTSANSRRAGGPDTPVGLITGFVSLFADSVTSNYQEKTLKQLKRPVNEMLLITNGFSTIGIFVILLFSGEIPECLAFLDKNPFLMVEITASALLGYAGLNVWTATIKGFGAVVATGAGILRKFLNLLFSFWLFPKPITADHAWGIIIFFAGLTISWVQQNQRDSAARRQLQAQEQQLDNLESGRIPTATAKNRNVSDHSTSSSSSSSSSSPKSANSSYCFSSNVNNAANKKIVGHTEITVV